MTARRARNMIDQEVQTTDYTDLYWSFEVLYLPSSVISMVGSSLDREQIGDEDTLAQTGWSHWSPFDHNPPQRLRRRLRSPRRRKRVC